MPSALLTNKQVPFSPMLRCKRSSDGAAMARSRSIGAIGRDAIVGRAVAVTWPLGKISTISRIDDTAAEPGQTPAPSEKPAPSEREKADKIEKTDEADNTEEATDAASEEPEATNLSEVPADN